jgi:hypothetical protein
MMPHLLLALANDLNYYRANPRQSLLSSPHSSPIATQFLSQVLCIWLRTSSAIHSFDSLQQSADQLPYQEWQPAALPRLIATLSFGTRFPCPLAAGLNLSSLLACFTILHTWLRPPHLKGLNLSYHQK